MTILLSVNAFSQQNDDYVQFVENLKKNTKVDKNDKTVYNLLNDFYNQALQSDKGELEQNMQQRIYESYSDTNSKNMHILGMFFLYQEHISKTIANGQNPDSKFLIYIINELESEINNIYGTIPVIIKIYKSEALDSDGQNQEAANLISKSLEEFPDSIPLKVYKYLGTKDERIKADLIKNHSNHWLVKQNNVE